MFTSSLCSEVFGFQPQFLPFLEQDALLTYFKCKRWLNFGILQSPEHSCMSCVMTIVFAVIIHCVLSKMPKIVLYASSLLSSFEIDTFLYF